MKGKFGVAALLFSSITFAVPVSTPNQLSDTPIIAGGGSAGNLRMNECRAYQTDGTSINLSGGETLVFYGGGLEKNGGYLATKTTYSGTAYVKLSKDCSLIGCGFSSTNSAIGLFARNTDAQQDFIAGAGGGSYWWSTGDYSWDFSSSVTCSPASGGGWQGEPALCTETRTYTYMTYKYPYITTKTNYRIYAWGGGSVHSGYWFHAYRDSYYYHTSSPGFFGSFGGGGASSISAWYNYYTKDYTSPPTSATITGGGIVGQGRLYVCQ